MVILIYDDNHWPRRYIIFTTPVVYSTNVAGGPMLARHSWLNILSGYTSRIQNKIVGIYMYILRIYITSIYTYSRLYSLAVFFRINIILLSLR